MTSLLDTDPRLAAELAEIKLLAGAACAAIFGSTTEKQETYRQAARDSDWHRRFMQEPWLDSVVGSSAADKLRRYKRHGSKPPRGGLLNLEEVANAGRDVVAAVPGIGKVCMAKLDKAIGEEDGLEWAERSGIRGGGGLMATTTVDPTYASEIKGRGLDHAERRAELSDMLFDRSEEAIEKVEALRELLVETCDGTLLPHTAAPEGIGPAETALTLAMEQFDAGAKEAIRFLLKEGGYTVEQISSEAVA